jgi:hypothetical protein
MADGLVASGELIGRTRDEVLSKLGAPTDTGKFAGDGLVYWLGPERSSISVDSEWLVVRIGADGKVSEVDIRSD